MDHTVIMDELKTGSYIQELKISYRVSDLDVGFYGRVLTKFVQRSGRFIAKERMFPNAIH